MGLNLKPTVKRVQRLRDAEKRGNLNDKTMRAILEDKDIQPVKPPEPPKPAPDAARPTVSGCVNGETQRVASTGTDHGHITCHAGTAEYEAGHAGTAETGKHRAATRNADGGKAGDCTNVSQQRHSDLRREQAAGRLQSSGR